MLEKKSQRIFNFSLNFTIIAVLVVILFAGLVAGVVVTAQSNIILDKKIATEIEATRPADIKIAILTEPSCKDCYNINTLIENIKKLNVKVISEDTFDISSTQGSELIQTFNITQAPNIIITGEIQKHEELKKLWEQLGGVTDDVFFLKQVPAPYVLTSSGDVRGRVKITMLTDKNCTECYDVTNHLVIMGRFGVPLSDQQVNDIGLPDGRKLLNQYDIDMLPTLILTGDIEAYPAVQKVWAQVGTVEDDGAYVFRNGVKQMGIYKDLNTGLVVKPPTKQTQSQ